MRRDDPAMVKHDTNLTGVFNARQPRCRIWRRGGGFIINISSLAEEPV